MVLGERPWEMERAARTCFHATSCNSKTLAATLLDSVCNYAPCHPNKVEGFDLPGKALPPNRRREVVLRALLLQALFWVEFATTPHIQGFEHGCNIRAIKGLDIIGCPNLFALLLYHEQLRET